jgi:phosphoglycolate phosphatase-like HAD superfamily hydrolase
MDIFAEISKYPKVIYDFDGTIAKVSIPLAGWKVKMDELFTEFDSKYVKTEFRNVHYNDFVRRFGAEFKDRADFDNAEYENELLDTFEPNEDLVAYIKSRRLQDQAVLSSNSNWLVRTGLEFCGLSGCFHKVLGREDVDFVKPHPFGILKIIGQQLHSDFVMVGDSPEMDKAAAEAAGIGYIEVKI